MDGTAGPIVTGVPRSLPSAILRHPKHTLQPRQQTPHPRHHSAPLVPPRIFLLFIGSPKRATQKETTPTTPSKIPPGAILAHSPNSPRTPPGIQRTQTSQGSRFRGLRSNRTAHPPNSDAVRRRRGRGGLRSELRQIESSFIRPRSRVGGNDTETREGTEALRAGGRFGVERDVRVGVMGDDSASRNATDDAAEIRECHRRALAEAIAGSTALVSCVGSCCPTNFWTDYIRVPIMRILRRDVSKWCSDRNHPYYVHYLTTRRILEEAEKEQRRREAWMEFERERAKLEEQLEKKRTMHEEKGFESSIAREFERKRHNLGKVDSYYNSVLFVDLMAENNSTMPLKLAAMTDRIKFIRISDVNVGRNPWRLGNVLANVFRSLVFRYEDMGEKLLKQSQLVDTIVLRVGDVTGEERNTNNTSLQLSINGVVPTPSVVGQDDVAELAVVTALTQIHDPKYSDEIEQHTNSSNVRSETTLPPPKHFTWAVRWAGQHLNPPQGL
ncbi:hypothetical protein ACHAWX_007579 [Stephanocyclus meneghinianus]